MTKRKPSVTIEQVMEWGPCLPKYTEERIRKLFGLRKRLTALQILRLPIPEEDWLWAVLHSDFLTDQQMRLFACDCAERVLPIFKAAYPSDKHPRECIDVARRFANGAATKEELSAARDAAWAAAGAAAKTAAWYAERKWQGKRIKEYLTNRVEVVK